MGSSEAVDAIRAFAFGLPGAYEDHPWGESVAKVNKRVFVFFGMGHEDRVDMTVKLPASNDEALSMPFAKPAGYGLDRGRWVEIHCPADELPPLDVLIGWIEESYRAVAPKRLVAELDAR